MHKYSLLRYKAESNNWINYENKVTSNVMQWESYTCITLPNSCFRRKQEKICTNSENETNKPWPCRSKKGKEKETKNFSYLGKATESSAMHLASCVNKPWDDLQEKHIAC